jgi:tetratricopeptide (TPR) repeat protein
MTNCTGAPAELFALGYVEGTLPQIEAERFEEHYFDCPVCLKHLQAVQAMAQALAQQPVATVKQPRLKMPLAWPVWAWSGGAVAALLLVSVFAYKSLEPKPAQPAVAQNEMKSLPQAAASSPTVRASATPVHLSQLADLTMPAYLAPRLRGENLDAHFEAGMTEYAAGSCKNAIVALQQVAEQSAEAQAASFYSGACQMSLGDFGRAAKLLHKLADAGDSPQKEAAIYELAQIALASNDSAAAHMYLQRTIALHGDFEQRARGQQRQLAKLIAPSHPAPGENPASK